MLAGGDIWNLHALFTPHRSTDYCTFLAGAVRGPDFGARARGVAIFVVPARPDGTGFFRWVWPQMGAPRGRSKLRLGGHTPMCRPPAATTTRAVPQPTARRIVPATAAIYGHTPSDRPDRCRLRTGKMPVPPAIEVTPATGFATHRQGCPVVFMRVPLSHAANRISTPGGFRPGLDYR